MPVVPKKKAGPNPATDRRQSIVGPERSIDDGGFGVVPLRMEGVSKVVRGEIVNPGEPGYDTPVTKTVRRRTDIKSIETIEIESSAPPIPPRGLKQKKTPMISKMRRGDFVLIEDDSKTLPQIIRGQARRYGVNVVTRTNFSHNGKVGLGVWCV